MVRLAKTPFGFFAIAMQNQIVDIKELPKDAKKVAKILSGDDFEKWRAGLVKKGMDIKNETFDPMKAASLLGIKSADYLKFARVVEIEISKIKIKKFIGKDFLILQSVGALDDLTKSTNIVVNRIREWYGLHHPEFRVDDHEKFLKQIIKGVERKQSMGVELGERDIKAIIKMATTILEMYKLRSSLEHYLDDLMEEVAPNTKALAGTNLGARLIERAGSLSNLVKMPASTIQVLGAEKALFKHLQKGSPSPKHGVIFQHPSICRSPKNVRGKIARAVATKIALGSKVDFFSGKINKNLQTSLEKRIKEVLK